MEVTIVPTETSPPPLTLEQLMSRVRELSVRGLENRSAFDDQHYVRRILHWEPGFEVVMLCWNPGQSSSIHDHNGSHCVTRVLGGRFIERLFREDRDSGLFQEISVRPLLEGEVSGLDRRQTHQMINASARSRGILLNCYSPALSPPPRSPTGRHIAVSLI